MAAVLIGAGIAAGVKWLVREVSRVAEDAGLTQDVRQGEPLRVVTKDLGKLEYDQEAGVYRPAGKRTN
jgi:hypothetical protein